MDLCVVDGAHRGEGLEEEEHQEAEADLLAGEVLRAAEAEVAAVDSLEVVVQGVEVEGFRVVDSGDDEEEDMYFFLAAFGSSKSGLCITSTQMNKVISFGSILDAGIGWELSYVIQVKKLDSSRRAYALCSCIAKLLRADSRLDIFGFRVSLLPDLTLVSGMCFSRANISTLRQPSSVYKSPVKSPLLIEATISRLSFNRVAINIKSNDEFSKCKTNVFCMDIMSMNCY